MKTLTIKDLSIAEELDAARMSAVRGGFGFSMPSYSKFHMPSYKSTDITTQSNTQLQSNPTGNGSAVFGGAIFASNEQSAVNFNGTGFHPL